MHELFSTVGLIGILSLSGSASLLAQTVSPESKNMFQNPSFEEGMKGWKFYDYAKGGAKLELLPNGRNGQKAAKITLIGAGGTCGNLEQVLKQKEISGKRYKFSFWGKCLDRKIHYRIGYVHELPSNKYFWIKPTKWKGEWAEYSVTFDTTPEEAAALACGVYIRHQGTLLVDDFALVEVPKDDKDLKAATENTPKAYAGKAEGTQFFTTHANPVDLDQRGDSLFFANKQVGLEFRRLKKGYSIARLYSIRHDQDFLTADYGAKSDNLFRIILKPDLRNKDGAAQQNVGVGPNEARTVRSWRTGDHAESTLHLEWKGIDLLAEKEAMDVEVTVKLKANDPFSRWRINIKNRSKLVGISYVYLPIIDMAPIGDSKDNVFIFPKDRGRLVEDPFHKAPGFGDNLHRSGSYPRSLGMQFQALYNKRSGTGLFLGTQSTAPDLISLECPSDANRISWRPHHFPPNMGYAGEDYSLPYDCIIGPFTGDWWDACQIYRQWALRQSWCRKGPLTTRQDIPTWFKETPLYLKTRVRQRDEDVAKAVDDCMQFLKLAGVPVPCDWYGWRAWKADLSAYKHPASNPGDGCYPKIPALPSFSAACKKLRAAGVMVCPYICIQILDQGSKDNGPYTEEARSHRRCDQHGNPVNYTGEPAWGMCTGSKWWINRQKELCVTAIKRENVSGFYLDTMHGAGEPCGSTTHGHSAGGGSTLTLQMHALSDAIRKAVKATDPQAITTGEDSTENMIDVIDGKLYQHTLAPYTAPLFATVYKEYIRGYGLGLWPYEDEFYMQAGSLFVEGAPIGRIFIAAQDRGTDVSYELRFDNPKHKPMIDFLARLIPYYRQLIGKKFLCYGQLMRPLAFRDALPVVSCKLHESTYANQVANLPALLSGVFRSADGEVGVFVVNISAQDLAFASKMALQEYGFSANAVVDVEAIAADGSAKSYRKGLTGSAVIEGKVPSRDILLFRLRQKTD